jgi:hypothetical protein
LELDIYIHWTYWENKTAEKKAHFFLSLSSSRSELLYSIDNKTLIIAFKDKQSARVLKNFNRITFNLSR